MPRSLRPWCAAIALALAAAGAALAREGAEEEAAAQDPSYAAARNAIAERRYADALRLLGEALGRNPRNADTHNLLGYAYRKTGDLDRAFQHYREALQLKPTYGCSTGSARRRARSATISGRRSKSTRPGAGRSPGLGRHRTERDTGSICGAY